MKAGKKERKKTTDQNRQVGLFPIQGITLIILKIFFFVLFLLTLLMRLYHSSSFLYKFSLIEKKGGQNVSEFHSKFSQEYRSFIINKTFFHKFLLSYMWYTTKNDENIS